MMGLAVLNPQNCLRDASPHARISSSPNNLLPKPNRNRAPRPRHSRKKTVADSKSPKAGNLVMGQVKILKRGEELTRTTTDRSPVVVEKENPGDTGLDSPDQLAPSSEPAARTEMGLTHSDRLASFYSGASAFIASPPPSSLPLPAFFTKKRVAISTVVATSDLRRILRLDLSQ